MQPVLGDGRQAGPPHPSGAGAGDVDPVDLHRAPLRHAGAAQHLDQLALAVAGHPAHPHDLAGVHRQVDAAQGRGPAVVAHLDAADGPHDHPVPVAVTAAVTTAVTAVVDSVGRVLHQRGGEHHVSPHHQPGQLSAVGAGHRASALGPAVSQHRDPVGHRPHLVELVGDEDHRAALGGHGAQHREQGLGLLGGEDGGGLVEDQDAGVLGQDLEDLHPLLLAHRQLPDAGGGVDRQVVALTQLVDALLDLAPGHRARTPQGQVLGHREGGHQTEVLVDHADARGDGVAG